jgi:hypothetical protein
MAGCFGNNPYDRQLERETMRYLDENGDDAIPTWLYLRSEPGLWTVGFYDPSGKWHPESEHSDSEMAARRVHYLNGGKND